MPALDWRTVVVLIDFAGHPVLGSEYENELRYAALKSICFNNRFPPVVIVSDHIPTGEMTDNIAVNPREEEIKKLVEVEGRHVWLSIDPDEQPTVEDIKSMIIQKGYRPRNIILGGTNTVGCVLKNKNYSLLKWAEYGYDTTLFLPMCNDYQLPGRTWAERVMTAWSIVSDRLDRIGPLAQKIDIKNSVEDLKMYRPNSARIEQAEYNRSYK